MGYNLLINGVFLGVINHLLTFWDIQVVLDRLDAFSGQKDLVNRIFFTTTRCRSRATPTRYIHFFFWAKRATRVLASPPQKRKKIGRVHIEQQHKQIKWDNMNSSTTWVSHYYQHPKHALFNRNLKHYVDKTWTWTNGHESNLVAILVAAHFPRPLEQADFQKQLNKHWWPWDRIWFAMVLRWFWNQVSRCCQISSWNPKANHI